jgi:hypothetical protein
MSEIKKTKHPARIHLIDDEGRRLRTYYPATPATPVVISSAEWFRMFGRVNLDVSIKIADNVSLGEGASISFSYQPYYKSGHSVTGTDTPGTRITASHPDFVGRDERFYPGRGPVTANFCIEGNKILDRSTDRDVAERAIEIVCEPCGHHCLCTPCSAAISKISEASCPICRAHVEKM